MINPAQFTLLGLGLAIIMWGTISYRKWRRLNVDKIAKKPEETSLDLYGWAKDPAKQIKIALQMLLGIGLVVLILTKLFCAHNSCQPIPVVGDIVRFYSLSKISVLAIVGKALAYASAIELAYTLFTPGPDEVVDPLLMGLSAAILLGIAQIDDLTLQKAGATALYLLVLAGLFTIREIFIKDDVLTKALRRQKVRHIWLLIKSSKKTAKVIKKR